MPNRTVSVELDEHLAAFVDAQVKAGLHPDAASVLRAALAEYEAEEEVVAELDGSDDRDHVPPEVLDEIAREGRAAIRRGDFVTLRDDAALSAYFEEIWAEACARSAEVGGRRRRA